MTSAIRSLWAEPRAPDAPARLWWDWALVAVLIPLAVVEVIVREELPWPPLAFAVGVVAVLSLLWRRSRPVVVVAVAFGAHSLPELAPLVGPDGSATLHGSATLNATAFVLLLPYTLCRWGSGREVVVGLAVALGAHVPAVVAGSIGLGELLLADVLLLFIAAVGVAMRYRTRSRVSEIDQMRLREREQLARELHDTVAHNVSAVVIQAQAGRTLAASHPGAAVAALEVIEEAAKRTLAEMRVLVGVLRQGEAPDLAPQRGVADIERLAIPGGDGPVVDVGLSGDLRDLSPLMEAALFRLAQESVTNAWRHARNAARVTVRVVGDGDCVRLKVSDDGEKSPFDAAASSGYGLVGMAERAKLLGGTLEAGPSPEGGWVVLAVLPRDGPTL